MLARVLSSSPAPHQKHRITAGQLGVRASPLHPRCFHLADMDRQLKGITAQRVVQINNEQTFLIAEKPAGGPTDRKYAGQAAQHALGIKTPRNPIYLRE